MRHSRHTKTRPSRVRRQLGALALAALVAGCSSATDSATLPFEFHAPSALLRDVGLSAGPRGTINVQWNLRTPCEPYGATAQVRQVGDVIAITVIGEATGPCPMDVTGSMPYLATISGVEEGRHTVRVVHRYADANWPDEVAINEVVDVP